MLEGLGGKAVPDEHEVRKTNQNMQNVTGNLVGGRVAEPSTNFSIPSKREGFGQSMGACGCTTCTPACALLHIPRQQRKSMCITPLLSHEYVTELLPPPWHGLPPQSVTS